MEKSWSGITTALAGMTQNIHQVDFLARQGYLDTAMFETAMKGLFNQNPDSAEDVYGGLDAIKTGLEILYDLLDDHKAERHRQTLRYIFGVLHLQKRLSRRSDILHSIGARLEGATTQIQHFGYTHDNVTSNVASIYADTISQFQYRIQVVGEAGYLQQERVASQIRALLLSSIRSATLWRQLGGSRLQFVLQRSTLRQHAMTLRNSLGD